MNKLPAKQIYLLSIIVFGIVALSAYSTYAIFTFENETSNIINIHTPNTLAVNTSVYEYKRVTVPKNSSITTDVDIYNTFNYELCYSIWYKIATLNIDPNKVNIFEKENTNTSGIIENLKSKRVRLLVINDSDQDVIIDIGVASSQNDGTCQLNISSDKQTITNKIADKQLLSDYIINNNNKTNNHEAGYITIDNIKDEILLDQENLIISKNFDYQDELFTLKNTKEVSLKEILDYTDINEYYTCIKEDNCQVLYKINRIEKSKEDEEDIYKLVSYNKYIGYQKGVSGIRNVNNNY